MLEHVQCTCGNHIGRFYLAFQKIRTHLTKNKLSDHEIHIDNIMLVDANQINLEEVFQAFRINRMCCRMHISTVMNIFDISDVYEQMN